MVLYPAIDIRGGHAVRLEQGDYGRETAYDADPLDAARRWDEQGASFLHVVDLDGARSGSPENLEHVSRIAAARGPGPARRRAAGRGGRRRCARRRRRAGGARDGGACATRSSSTALAAEHGERVVVALDASAGRVAVAGWEQSDGGAGADLIARWPAAGCAGFVYTPIEVDGTLEGPALDGLRAVAAAAAGGGAELIYSGGSARSTTCASWPRWA